MIMLSEAALASAQPLVDAGWVNVGAMPLMLLNESPSEVPALGDVRALGDRELADARELLFDAVALDHSSAAIVLPDSLVVRPDMGIWGIFEHDQLVGEVTVVSEQGVAAVWSMATLRSRQGEGFGRQLLTEVLREKFAQGASASLLSSSKAGERLYRSLGYVAVEYVQLWSRPHWVLGSS
ncbi:MAG: GNAT family N-acetyltransferase [Acidimicrobiales bacterium]